MLMSASLGCMSKSMGQTARHLTEGGKTKRAGGGGEIQVPYSGKFLQGRNFMLTTS